jgi:hypothetical protein
VIRYSPKPLSEYAGTVQGTPYGPAHSTLLCVPQAWNLAYLSFDFDKALHHRDPYFSTHVVRTMQTRLDGGGEDIIEKYPPSQLVQGLLSLPAPRFVYLIRHHSVLQQLPLFLNYGQAWLDTIEERSRICGADDVEEPTLIDLSLANDALARYSK